MTALGKLLQKITIGQFILGWLAIAIMQAYLTPIHFDEAYYWVFSQKLDWGYFDHPPLMALYIFIGKQFLPGILGVRIIAIASSCLSIFVLWKLSQKQDVKLSAYHFTLLYLLFPLFQIYSIISTPDSPLFLGICMLLYSYFLFIKKENILHIVALAFSMAFILYAKYHGGLAIILILLSNPNVFKRWPIYVVGMLTCALWAPHIVWQYQHDFISFKYQMFDRIGNRYYYDPFKYIMNICLVFNPFLVYYLIKIWKSKWSNPFEKSLFFILFGFIFFFGISLLFTAVQAQWLLVPTVAFFLLITKKDILKKPKLLFIAIITTSIVMLFGRTCAIWDILPGDINLHRKKSYVEKIDSQAANLPVLYYSSYKRAAIHQWYQQNQDYVHSYNGAIGRQNQYNLWDRADAMDGQDVYIVGYDSILIGEERYLHGFPLTYQSSDRIKTEVQHYELKKTQNGNGEISFSISILNPYCRDVSFAEDHHNLYVISYNQQEEIMEQIPIFNPEWLIKCESFIEVNFSCSLGSIEDIYYIGLSISKLDMPPGPIYTKIYPKM